MECQDGCTCHYNQIHKANIFKCSGSHYTYLPDNIPNFTQWILYQNTNVTELCGILPYLNRPSNISSLNITSGNLSRICPDTLKQIMSNSNVTSLDLSYNRLSQLPQELGSYRQHQVKVRLMGNPLKCSCEMTWLIDWLAGQGKDVIAHYQKVTCNRGREIGQPVYLVKPWDMGCYLRDANMIITILIPGALVTFLMMIMGLIIRNSDMRWLMYRNFGQLIGDPDKDEDIDILAYDAFVSFW